MKGPVPSWKPFRPQCSRWPPVFELGLLCMGAAGTRHCRHSTSQEMAAYPMLRPQICSGVLIEHLRSATHVASNEGLEHLRQRRFGHGVATQGECVRPRHFSKVGTGVSPAR